MISEKEKPKKILCRTCAEYGGCKLEKKGSAILFF